jgi:hypothetical protein
MQRHNAVVVVARHNLERDREKEKCVRVRVSERKTEEIKSPYVQRRTEMDARERDRQKETRVQGYWLPWRRTWERDSGRERDRESEIEKERDTETDGKIARRVQGYWLSWRRTLWMGEKRERETERQIDRDRHKTFGEIARPGCKGTLAVLAADTVDGRDRETERERETKRQR